jgi:TRAP-type C4-dicarboxylate transport system permease large subunit
LLFGLTGGEDYQNLDSFGLLAPPLFILTGDLINVAGIAKRLFDFAYSLLGWMRGTLATREIKLRNLPNIVFRSSRITGLLAALIAVSIVM